MNTSTPPDIIPLMRSLGEQAHQQAIVQTIQSGATISCQKGCGARCRMMIPLALPEAIVLKTVVKALPSPQKKSPCLNGFSPFKGPCVKPA